MNYLADLSYLAIKKESTEGVAVKPDVFLPMDSSDVATAMNNTPDRRMFGVDFEAIDVLPGERSHTGSIVLWADPDSLGYIFTMFLKKGTTTGSAEAGYTHPFTPEEPNTYTIEIPKGPYAQRFFGVKGNALRLFFEEAKMKADLNVSAMGQVSSFRIAAALTAETSTEIVLSQEYDLEPTRGLVIGDQIVIGAGTASEETGTISAIDTNGYEITLASAVANSHDIGELCFLKKQSVSHSVLQKPLFFGDVQVGFGATAAAAITAAGSKTTATPVSNLEINFGNNLNAVPMTNYRDPSKILPTFRNCDITITQLLDEPDQHQAWLGTEKQAICILANGRLINASTGAKNQLSWLIHNAKLIDNAEPLNVGDYVRDEQNFKAVYDITDGKALTISLINETSNY
jgi:hypothetical protein